MKWLVEDFINKGENIIRFRKALDDLNIEYLLVKVDKNNNLKVLNKDLLIEEEDSLFILNNFIKTKDVLIYGSKKLAELSNNMSIFPGSLSNKNFNLDIVYDNLKDELLNNDFELKEIKDIFINDNDRVFIRPIENNKLLDGKLYNNNELSNLKSLDYLKGVKLFTSTLKDIKEEYRFFVVNNKIVTFSSYRDNNKKFNCNLVVEEDLISYVNYIINKFKISNGYVIDIAKINDGYKVIEYNNLNTSGLYNCDEYKIVESLMYLKFDD